MNDSIENNKFIIHEAVREGKELMVRGLLSENPKLVQLKDLDGRVPLHWAVSANNQLIVSLLLNPFKDAKPDKDGKPFKKFEIDIDDYVDDSGWTPLHIAASIGNLEIIELLLNHEPNPSINLQTSTGQTVLHYSTSKNLYETTAFLLKNGASARIKDNKGQYPIFRAASIGSIRLVELLYKTGKSQLNIKDSFGWTALHHALAEGFGDVAIELVKLGADPKIENNEGETPVQVSVDQKVEQYFKHHLKEMGIESSK